MKKQFFKRFSRFIITRIVYVFFDLWLSLTSIINSTFVFQFFKILNILKKNLKFNQIFRTNINVVKFTKIKNNKKIIISTIETKIFQKNLKTNV